MTECIGRIHSKFSENKDQKISNKKEEIQVNKGTD